MATITTAGAGNWSSIVPDTPWPGGTLPTTDDDVVINHAVTWDSGAETTLPAAGVFTSISFGASGQLIVGAKAGALTLNSATIQGGAIGTGGSIAYTASTCDSFTINAPGGTTGCASGGSSPYCILKTSSKPFTHVGPITGGAVASSHGLYINGTSGQNTITGAVTGGAGGSGITTNIGCLLSVGGNVTGGTATNVRGILINATNYTFNLISGNIIGGAAAGSNGLGINSLPGTGSITLHNACNFIDGSGAVAYSGPLPTTFAPTLTNYKTQTNIGGDLLTWAPIDKNGTPILPAASVESGVVVGGGANPVTGTLVATYTVNGITCA